MSKLDFIFINFHKLQLSTFHTNLFLLLYNIIDFT